MTKLAFGLWLVGFAFSKTDQNNFEISGSTTSNEN
jgi:hypothetical protein